MRTSRHWLPVLAAGLALIATAHAAEGPADQPLPLTKVVLFNSGVGFFQHAAQVEGDRKVELKFNVNDINDLLKSMVLQDLGGGRISTVTYASKDPITKTLRTFAIDLTDNPSLGALLDQVRGERIEVEAPNKIQGTVLGVERRKEQVGKDDTIEKEYLNLLTDEGLRSLALSGVARIKLLNDKLDGELRQALSVLAMGHETDKKSVTLEFLGQGKRPVQVGYIQEAPIWKTSYRLVLKDNEAPFLQGWAIVENTTEHDWSGVQLTLVSGRPISFVMNLYDPLYISRPVVEPELFASLRPQTYGQDLAEDQAAFGRKADKAANGANRLHERAAALHAQAGQLQYGDAVPTAPAIAAAAAPGANAAELPGFRQDLDLQRGVQSAAQAVDVGELFQYVIDTPVTLPRRQSAMLPIVQGSVKGEKLSIYNQAVQAKHPLNGLRLTNSTNQHLMQGPITVFDGGAYAGDARIEDLPPDGQRLVSYALDLDTEVAPTQKYAPEQLVSVTIAKGTLATKRKLQRTQEYTVKNSGQRAKQVLIEYPHEASWKLVAPEKPAETTRDLYRFALKAEPGKPAKLKIEEEQQVYQEIAVTNLNDGLIQYYTSSKVVSESIKVALAEVVKRKQELGRLNAERQLFQSQINVIGEEQNRIRQNMNQLDRNSDLYLRYIKKFSDQEDQIEKLRAQVQGLGVQIDERQHELDEYLRGLTVS